MWSSTLALLIVIAIGAGAVGWVARDAAEQRKRTEEVLVPVLDETESLLADGRWREARIGIRRAEGAAAGGHPGPGRKPG